MSDILADEPVLADDNAPVETGEVDSKPVDADGADPATAAAETGKPDARDKVQERFDKLTRERYEAAARADRAEYRWQEAERRLAEREAAKTETVAPSDDYPSLESVGWDEEKHRVAVAKWNKSQIDGGVKSVLAQEREAAERQVAEQAHSRREAEFIKAKPDYESKVLRHPSQGGPTITEQMAQVIRASDIGPEVAYYLAENAAKSAEIARLPSFLQAREIGRIEERIEKARTALPPVSKATPPVSKIDTGGAAAQPDPSKMSDDEWYRWDQKQNRRKK